MKLLSGARKKVMRGVEELNAWQIHKIYKVILEWRLNVLNRPYFYNNFINYQYSKDVRYITYLNKKLVRHSQNFIPCNQGSATYKIKVCLLMQRHLYNKNGLLWERHRYSNRLAVRRHLDNKELFMNEAPYIQ